MIQFPGPPVVPPVLPFKVDEEQSEKDQVRKRNRRGDAALSRWRRAAGGVFVGLAVVLNLALLPRFEALAFFAGPTAFVLAALLWTWLMPRREAVTAVRGAVAGGLTGLLTPPLMWVLYGGYLGLSAARPSEGLGWALAYAYEMLVRVSAFTLLPGAAVGAVLAQLQRSALRPPARG